jgi:hypothetical protein
MNAIVAADVCKRASCMNPASSVGAPRRKRIRGLRQLDSSVSLLVKLADSVVHVPACQGATQPRVPQRPSRSRGIGCFLREHPYGEQPSERLGLSRAVWGSEWSTWIAALSVVVGGIAAASDAMGRVTASFAALRTLAPRRSASR